MNRPTVTRRQLAFGSTMGVAILLAALLLAFVSYLSHRHYKRMDWTRSQLFTLSEKTLNILADLDQDVDAVVFMDMGSNVYEPVKEILARYAAASPHINVEFVDPIKNMAKAQQLVDQYEIQRADVVVFVGENDRRVIDGADLADYDYSAMQMGGPPEMTGFKGEQVFTRTLVDLVEHRKPEILFTTGHGEASLDAQNERGLGRLQEFLGDDNFTIDEWSSLGASAVPEGTDLVVVAGPTAAFSEPELETFSTFLDGGGRMLILVDPQLAGTGELAVAPLVQWLGSYGIDSPSAIVIDPAKLLPFFGAETIFADAYGAHPITESLSQARLSNIFPLARPVRAATGYEAEVRELVRTSSEGWGETNLENLNAVELGDDDVVGPVSLGVALDLNPQPSSDETSAPSAEAADDSGAPSTGGRLVVFGDSDFMTNAQIGQAGNVNLIVNTMNWLVERQSHLGIAPKAPDDVRLSMTPGERNFMFWLVLLGLPSASALIGIFSFLRRRRR
ncbi:MAG: GldG family protein [Thermoanaerobaculia bacterium]|nr:GldG family protein [Thermoanaerobaculia bacterium]